MARTKIVFRVDGNSEIGLGHFSRSLALADMLRNDFDCIFATSAPSAGQLDELKKLDLGFWAVPAGPDHFSKFLFLLSGSEIVVLDNYFFDSEYQREIKRKGCKLICIDDLADKHFVADAVINHCGGVTKNDYSVEGYTLLFLGPEYRLLKRPFLEFKKSTQKLNNNNVFVCLGGADPHNATLEVLKNLSLHFSYDTVFCVIGGANKNYDSLKKFIGTSPLNIQLLENLDVNQMINYMIKSKWAITSASTVAYECLTIGNQLFILKTAENQSKLYDYLISQGFAKDFNSWDKNLFEPGISGNVFYESSAPGIRNFFRALDNSKSATLRKADIDDLMIVYKWINDVQVRKQSYSSSEIKLQDHTQWFNKMINKESAYYYIIEANGVPYGQIRFEKVNKDLTINYLLAPEARGRGQGLMLVKAGIERVLIDVNEKINIVAYVKTDNLSSNRIFERLPFKCQVSSEFPGSNKYYYSYIENE